MKPQRRIRLVPVFRPLEPISRLERFAWAMALVVSSWIAVTVWLIHTCGV